MFPLKDDQPRYSTPYVNGFLIGINILIYSFQFLQLLQDPRGADAFMREYAEVPAHLAAFLGGSHRYTLQQVVLPFFTSMFLHGGWMHVLGNMWFLWLFGNNVESGMGHGRFLAFYLLCGLAAAAAQIGVDPSSAVPMIGASGAISGVMGAYVILYPKVRVHILVFLILIFRTSVPAWVMLGYWFVLQLLGTGMEQGVGGVAVWAHIGGFLAGAVLIALFRSPTLLARREEILSGRSWQGHPA